MGVRIKKIYNINKIDLRKIYSYILGNREEEDEYDNKESDVENKNSSMNNIMNNNIRKNNFSITSTIQPYRINKINKKRKYRSTHCFQCKSDIDTETNEQCNNCKWIICDCGACGCDYENENL